MFCGRKRRSEPFVSLRSKVREPRAARRYPPHPWRPAAVTVDVLRPRPGGGGGSTVTPRERLLSLDALRGLAVLLMIEQHLGVWLWRGPDPGLGRLDYPVLVGFNALGGGAAPLFVTLAGVGSALFCAADRPRSDRTLVQRGATLLGFGLVLNLAAPSWFSWGSWFVLHMMGLAIMLTPAWRRLPDRALLVGLVAVLVTTVIAQNLLDTPTRLTNPRMRDVGLPGGAVRLALAEGQFPVLPWLAFFLGGFVGGRWITAGRLDRVARLGLAALIVGAVLATMYLLHVPPARSELLVRAFRVRLGFYPASPAFVLMLLGAVLLAVVAGLRIERRRGLAPNGPLVTLGRASLTLLMLHVPMFRELTRPLGLWQDMSAGAALATIAGFVIVSAVVTRAWHRARYRFGAEWLLRKIAG